MATITPVHTKLGGDDSTIKLKYETMTTTNDVGSPAEFTQWADRSVQVIGTFGAAGNCRIEGSNDGGVTWATLTDPQGNALDITGAKIEAIIEICELMRPHITAGDGTTDLDVFFVLRRAQQLRT